MGHKNNMSSFIFGTHYLSATSVKRLGKFICVQRHYLIYKIAAKMYKYFFVTCVLVVPAVFIGTVVGQDEIACKGHDLNMTETQKVHVTDCLKENGIKSIWKIPVEKLPCFGVCILKKKQLLTAAGKLDHDKILNYIMDVMKPDDVKLPLKEGIEKCMKDHGDNVEGNNDPKCMTFMEVGQCVHDVFFDICID